MTAGAGKGQENPAQQGGQPQGDPNSFANKAQPKKNPLMIDLTGGPGKPAQPMIPQQQKVNQPGQSNSSRDSLPYSKQDSQTNETQPKNPEGNQSAYKVPGPRQANSLE